MKRSTWWPIGITAVLAGTMGLNFWVLHVAKEDPSMVVEADYYKKALHWDDEMAQARRNVALGWTLVPTLRPVGADRQARITVALRDRDGRPVAGARVRLEGFAITRSATVVRSTLAERGAGYEGVIPVGTTGQWEFRFVAERGAERFTVTSRVDAVAAVPGPRPLGAMALAR